MKKLIALLVIAGFVCSSFGVSVVQNQFKSTTARAANAPNNQDWFLAANWNGNANVGIPGIPRNDTETQCNGATLYGSAATSYGPDGAVDSVIIANGNAEVGQLRVGSGTANTSTVTGIPAALTINSGTLTIGSQYSPLHNSGFMSIGSDSAATGSLGRNGLFYMNGGSVQALWGQGNIVIGNGNANGNCFGKMWMTGGTIECLNFYIGRNAGVVGEVYISGGTIIANQLLMKPNGGTQNVILDITGTGKIILSGDKTATIAQYIANGWLTGNGNDYDVVYEYNSATDKTTVFVPEPTTICVLGLGFLSLIRRK